MNLSDLIADVSLTPVRYTNVAEVGYNSIEIRLKFGFLEGAGRQSGVIELVMSPVLAKVVAKMLNEEVQHYETNIGPIYMPNDASGLKALFGGPAAEEQKDERP